MISDIKKYMKERKIVSLSDLSVHFAVDETALEKIMELLIEKGIVVRKDCTGKCSECSSTCGQVSKMVFYEYTG